MVFANSVPQGLSILRAAAHLRQRAPLALKGLLVLQAAQLATPVLRGATRMRATTAKVVPKGLTILTSAATRRRLAPPAQLGLLVPCAATRHQTALPVLQEAIHIFQPLFPCARPVPQGLSILRAAARLRQRVPAAQRGLLVLQAALLHRTALSVLQENTRIMAIAKFVAQGLTILTSAAHLR